MKKIYVGTAIALMLALLVGVAIGVGVGLFDSRNPYIPDETETVEVLASNTEEETETVEIRASAIEEETESAEILDSNIEEETETVEVLASNIEEETESVEIQTINTMDEEESIEAQTTIQNPNPDEPAFEFIDLVARPTTFGSKNTGVGCNASGVPVERCLEIVFDFPEEVRTDYTTSISCSWGHVVNGTYGRREEAADFEASKNGMTYTEFGTILNGRNGVERFMFFLCLPDDPSIEGPQSATVFVGSSHVTIYFNLIYDGGYEDGMGWKIRNVRY